MKSCKNRIIKNTKAKTDKLINFYAQNKLMKKCKKNKTNL